MANVTVAEKVRQYLRLRDYKKQAEEEFKKSMARVVEGMKMLEGELLAAIDASGMDHIGGRGTGTVYRRMELSCTVEDREAFLGDCIANDEWDALDVKANKTYVRARLDKGESLPPGVKVSTYLTVGVRR